MSHHRRSVRLADFDYAAGFLYLVTICTNARQPRFGSVRDGVVHLSADGRIAERCWLAIPTHFPQAGIDAYTLQPDHLHGIVWIGAAQTAGVQTIAGPQPTAGASHAVPLLVDDQRVGFCTAARDCSWQELQQQGAGPHPTVDAQRLAGAQHAVPLPADVPLPARRFGHLVPGSLPVIIRAYKAAVSRALTWERGPVWQRGYHETVLRSPGQLARARQYISGHLATHP